MKPQLICLVVLFLLSDCSSVKKRTDNINYPEADNFKSESLTGPGIDGSYVVSTSQIIDPAGETVTFPGRPVDFALNGDETILAVKNMQNVLFFSVKERKIIHALNYPKGGSSYNGVCWDNAEKKLWITDSRGFLRSVKTEAGSFSWDDEISLPGSDKGNPYPGGIAIDSLNRILYVALNRNNTLGIVDLETRKLMKEIPVGVAPFTVELYRGKAYVTNWGGRHPEQGEFSHNSSGTPVAIDEKTGVASTGTVSIINIKERKLIREIETGLHPCGMCLSADSSLLFVADANSDAVTVIDTKRDSVVDTFSSKPNGDLPFGSSPNDVCASPDGKTLYIANGGDNLISVYNLVLHKITGLIPAGWYPGSLEITRDGKTLIAGNLKGIGSRQEVRENGHNTHDQTGSLSFIDVPGEDSLKAYTARAAANMRLPKINLEMNLAQGSEKVVPVPVRPGEKSVFKHVIYIIKENRTYDQVLGDMPSGNGDSSLCMFGRKYTPNQHNIAEKFVLLDNTYCNGVLSAEGHNWTSQGYATDYLERSFPDWVRGYPWNGDDPLVYSPAGFIWDYVKKAGLIFRTYGEFVKDEVIPENATWLDIYRDYKSGSHRIKIRAIPTVHTLEDSYCTAYTGSPRTINDQYKADVFISELHEFEKNGNFPNLMMLSLPNNHTSGTQEGFPLPVSMVADNDLALGRIVEEVSKSKFWKETVIFVIEDDPQNGLDHVDGHRTTAFCISPYTKRGAVISTHYNQNSILRTIELILGLPPMTQFDLIAYPMSDCFTATPDFTPYEALPNNVPLDQMNPELSAITGEQLKWAKKSMAINLMENDDLEYDEEITLNKILWHSVKGYDVPYPESY